MYIFLRNYIMMMFSEKSVKKSIGKHKLHRNHCAFHISVITITILANTFSLISSPLSLTSYKSPDSIFIVHPHPKSPSRRSRRVPTVYMIPGLEGVCEFQFNHFCRLWIYLRCIVLAHFPDVVVIEDPVRNIPKPGKC